MSGCSLYLKLENFQKTGAFKVRGAYNKIAHLKQTERTYGVVTASAGNHAQGVALAAQLLGVPAVVVVPETAPESKIAATKAYGAEVVVYGENYDASYEKARALAVHRKCTFVHAFDDPFVIAGQGTIALEILESLVDLDALIVPVGGGGLISGVALAAKTLKPSIQIIGVQPFMSNALATSFELGRRVSISRPQSIADGLCVKQPGHLTFSMISKWVDQFIAVSEQEIKTAMQILLERTKILVEGAGAAAVAAALSGKVLTSLKKYGKVAAKPKVAVIVSGGNVDFIKFADMMSRVQPTMRFSG